MNKQGKPLVAIITPAYNLQEFLAETLDSILATSYDNYEVIIVDDGSSDKTYDIACEYATKYPHVRAYRQINSGVAAARNFAVSMTNAELILPIDGDDLITPSFVSLAVEAIMSDEDVMVVAPRSHFFGEKQGEWRLPAYSLNLLARRNLICVSAMYRRSDWERIRGYNEQLPCLEDWEFWISMLKDGGRVATLSEVVFYYRRRPSSRRSKTKLYKRKVIDMLNRLHPEFFERELGGPLRYQRTWSKLINRFEQIFQ